jgi:CelD/BcsL family acetyltransferase involved in cellulose biosynthesis
VGMWWEGTLGCGDGARVVRTAGCGRGRGGGQAVHFALAAADRGHAVLTSDDADIAAAGPGLVLVHV